MSFGKRKPLIDVFMNKNNLINLSAIREPEAIYTKHVMDSLELLKIFSFKKGQTACDLGTWWGFPFFPLAMECSDVSFVGLDARRKKIAALEDMISSLRLKNCSAEWWRAEDHEKRYAVVIARAVAHVDKLIPWMLNIVKKWGTLILYKEKNDEEKAALQQLCKKHKLSIEKEHVYVLEEWGVERVVYVIR